MISKVDDDEKLNGVIFRAGQKREMMFLTEDGFYEILMQSRKPIAKQFKKKVKEILKDIRKDGGYIATNEEDDESTIMAKALLVAQKTIDKKNKQLEEAKHKIAIDAPKVLFTDVVTDSNKAIDVGDLAKLISKANNRIVE